MDFRVSGFSASECCVTFLCCFLCYTVHIENKNKSAEQKSKELNQIRKVKKMKVFAMIAATAIVTVGTLLGGMTTTVCAADIKGFSGEESAPYLESFKNTEAQNEIADGSQYVGSYACGRAFLEIERVDSQYIASVVWGNSASETVEWTYPCTYDTASKSLLCDGKGFRMTTSFNEDGEIASQTIDTTDESAQFSFDGRNLTWEDADEDAGRDMLFEKLDF